MRRRRVAGCYCRGGRLRRTAANRAVLRKNSDQASVNTLYTLSHANVPHNSHQCMYATHNNLWRFDEPGRGKQHGTIAFNLVCSVPLRPLTVQLWGAPRRIPAAAGSCPPLPAA